MSVVSVSGEVMSQSLRLRRDSILRWRQTTAPTHCCCCVQRRVVMWVRCNIIAMAPTAWLESLCRRGRVVVVVDCSAVECDHCTSQRPTRDLHCLMTSDEATRRPCMNVELYHGRLLHSPTHTVTDFHDQSFLIL